MPLFVAAQGLAAPMMDQRLGWSCEALPSDSEWLHHRWDLPCAGAVGIASPAQSIHAAPTAESLAVDPTKTALIGVPLYAVTATNRTLEVCRSTYAVAA